MKVGIVGTGKIIAESVMAIKELPLDGIYVYGRNEEKAEKIRETYALDRAYTDYEAFLESDVDVVYIALPNVIHYGFAKKALEAKKHVILEKPITVTTEALDDLFKTADKQGCILIEAMNIHHLPAYQKMQELAKQVGNVRIVKFDYSQYSSRYDAFKEGIIQPAFDPHKAGGALMDLNVYNIQAVVGMFGAPKKVYYLANIEHDIDVSGILTMDYGSFKAVCIGAKDSQTEPLLAVQGDEGAVVAHMPINELRECELIRNKQKAEVFAFDRDHHRLYYEFQKFYQIIEQRDFEAVEKLRKISRISVQIMQEARAQAGLVFDGDQ